MTERKQPGKTESMLDAALSYARGSDTPAAPIIVAATRAHAAALERRWVEKLGLCVGVPRASFYQVYQMTPARLTSAPAGSRIFVDHYVYETIHREPKTLVRLLECKVMLGQDLDYGERAVLAAYSKLERATSDLDRVTFGFCEKVR